MRLWLGRLASHNLIAQDVIDALDEQNLQVGAGQNRSQQPAQMSQQYQIDASVLLSQSRQRCQGPEI